jgi:hypothetical protein
MTMQNTMRLTRSSIRSAPALMQQVVYSIPFPADGERRTSPTDGAVQRGSTAKEHPVEPSSSFAPLEPASEPTDESIPV